jgi:anti-sigma-K factor RskA
MSAQIPPDDDMPADPDDLLAAEYVLGTLPGDARRAAAERIAVDGAFAARVAEWESRLSPLNAGYADGAVPDLLPRIEAELFGPAATGVAGRGRRTLASWRAPFLAGLAVALVLLAVVQFGTAPGRVLEAELAEGEGALRFAARWDEATGELALTRVAGAAAPDGQDYELWQIGADGVPRSLGLLRGTVTELSAALDPGVTLAISLEPAGGSPAAVPTGPVLAAAPML